MTSIRSCAAGLVSSLRTLVLLVMLLPLFVSASQAGADPLSWGYLTKIGDGYNNVDDVIGVDYRINIGGGVVDSEITNLVVTLTSPLTLNVPPIVCSPTADSTGRYFSCPVRYTISQSDIVNGFVSLDGYFTYKYSGQTINGFMYTSSAAGSNNGTASPTSPNFLYVVPAPVFIPQTITHNIPSQSMSLDSAPTKLSFATTSGNTVQVITGTQKLNDPDVGVCSENNGFLYLDRVGTCRVELTVYGGMVNGVNYAGEVKVLTFPVTPGTNVITFDQPADVPLSNGSLGLIISAKSYDTPVYVFSQTPNVCDLANAASHFVSLKSVGTCTLRAQQAGGINYNSAQNVFVSFEVTKRSNEITFDQLADRSMTDGNFDISPLASSGLNVVVSTSSTACELDGYTVVLKSEGTCDLLASQGGNQTYAAAADVQRSFNITRGANDINYDAVVDKKFGDAPFALSASATSGLDVTLASATTGVCTLAGNLVTLVAPGTCEINATQAGDTTYLAAADQTISFTVDKAQVNFALDLIEGPIFASQTITLTARVSGVQSPTGSVDFYVHKTKIATVPLTNGVATTPYTTTTDGYHYFGAAYTGDTNNAQSGAKGVSITVDARPADPSQSTSTNSGVQAQNQAAQRYASAQNSNISDHLQNMDLSGSNSGSSGLRFEGNSEVMALAAAGQQIAAAGKGDLPFGMWVGGTIGFGSQDNQSNTKDKFYTSGVTVGFDNKISDTFLMGIAIGAAVDETKIGTDGSKIEGENYSAAFYATYRPLPSTYLDMLVGYGTGSLDTQRFDTLGSVMLNGTRETDQFFGSVSLKYQHKVDRVTLTPFLKARAEHTSAEAYAETGSPIWALAYDDMSATSLNAVAGLNTQIDVPVSWGKLVLTGGAEYSTQIAGDYGQTVRYADGAGGAFTITDAGTSSGQFTTSMGLALAVEQLTLDMYYKYSLADQNAKSHAISGTVRYEF